MCAVFAGPCSDGLEKKAPEEQDAQDYQDSNDDDLNETHESFLVTLGKSDFIAVRGGCQYCTGTSWGMPHGRTPVTLFSTLRESGLGPASGTALYPLIYHRKYYDLDRARHQSPNHYDRERLLDFGPRPGRNDEGYQADAADQRA